MVSGRLWKTSFRNSTPFIPGILKSEMTTWTSSVELRISSPSSPDDAVRMS